MEIISLEKEIERLAILRNNEVILAVLNLPCPYMQVYLHLKEINAKISSLNEWLISLNKGCGYPKQYVFGELYELERERVSSKVHLESLSSCGICRDCRSVECGTKDVETFIAYGDEAD
jgi:hypothetical protein